MLYDATARGRLPEGKRQLKLFVDPGLLPYAEGEVGKRLTEGVVQAVETLTQSLRSAPSPQLQTSLLDATFRLLAAQDLEGQASTGFHFASSDARHRSTAAAAKSTAYGRTR